MLYGRITPVIIHMYRFLEIVLPAFDWISVGHFFLGRAESFLWAPTSDSFFPPIYNWLYRRWGSAVNG